MRFLGLACAAWLAISSLVFGRDVYVNNVAGDDRFSGATPQSRNGNGPCRTIARALRAARRGDRIVIANTGEPYRECVTLHGGRHSGLVDAPFVVEGNGAVLDGSSPVPDAAWTPVRSDVFRFAPEGKAHQQLFREGVPLGRQEADDAGPLPELQPLQWCLYRGAIYFRVEKGKIPSDYDLSYAREKVGLTLYEVRRVEVRDLVVQGYQLDGVNAHDNAFDAALVGLTCRGNGRSGVSVGGASRVTIASCLIGNNGAAQVRTEGYSQTEIYNCDLIPNTAPALVRKGGAVTVEDAASENEADSP